MEQAMRSLVQTLRMEMLLRMAALIMDHLRRQRLAKLLDPIATAPIPLLPAEGEHGLRWSQLEVLCQLEAGRGA